MIIEHRKYKVKAVYNYYGYGKISHILDLFKRNKITKKECIEELSKIFNNNCWSRY